MTNFTKCFVLMCAISFMSCNRSSQLPHEEGGGSLNVHFSELSKLDIGEEGAAEISAYDANTQRLFVVDNSVSSMIAVIDLSHPKQMKKIHSIDIASLGGGVNSVAVHNGVLAAAVEAEDKQANGLVAIFDTQNYQLLATVPVGALPDMVTFSPDGKYILSANEGEPSDFYEKDPEGSVSIIDVTNNYQTQTLGFGDFTPQQAALEDKGLRIFGPNASFSQDLEPEYISIAADSKTAWVTLQENNAIAKIDLATKTVTDIFPLGFKDYSLPENAVDFSNADETISPKNYSVKGMYQPDAVAVLEKNGQTYLMTANEGDAREYETFEEEERIKKLTLDSQAFPQAAVLQQENNLGALKVTTTRGDANGDKSFESLYAFGARSFSVWDAHSGALVYDSANDLLQRTQSNSAYDDGRSDDKGVEPEGVTLGKIGDRDLLFVGLERADAVVVYEVSNPTQPQFLQFLKCGDAPEGLLFIPEDKSPTKRPILAVTSEGDGVISLFEVK